MKKVKVLIFKMIRALLKKKGYALDDYARTSFSQMGEDRVLDVIFQDQKNGFYVDVGAFHPKLYSNTYLFYLKGWRGINIDAMPGSMQAFRKLRPRDTNIEAPIAKTKKKLTYFMFDQPAINGFSQSLSERRGKSSEFKIIAKKKLTTYSLQAILDENLPSDQEIDFLSVDVEGMDLEILMSNDWKRYRPKIVIVEDLHFSLEKVDRSKTYAFLIGKQYSLISKTDVSLIFKSKR